MRTIVLLGLRGSGKSTVAKELGRIFGCSVVDLDQRIVEKAGKSIPEIFAEAGGSDRFRDLESDALEAALIESPGVLSPGAGVVTRDRNRDMILRSGAFAVYLAAKPETLARRVEQDKVNERPTLVSGGPLNEARTLLIYRDTHYRSLADFVVTTDDLDPATVSEKIRAALESPPP